MASKSKSAPALLAAIEGYTGEHAGSPAHESIIAQLQHVVEDVHRGSEPAGRSSPGHQAAHDAAGRSMGAEAGHSGGAGQKTSNEPGEAGAPDPLADIAGPDGRSDHLSGVAAVKSDGNRESALPGPGMAPGLAEIRRIAAQRELARQDTHMKPGAHNGGDNNREANPPGEAAQLAGRIGEAAAPHAVATGKEPDSQRAAHESHEQPAPPPVRTSQQRDPFAHAGEQARRKLAAAVR